MELPLPISRRIAVVLSLACIGLAAEAQAPTGQAHAIDGLSFHGQTGEQGKGEHHEDTITFEDGYFRYLDCENWGFSAAPYSVRKQGDSLLFEAILRSPDRGRLEWRGIITGDKASATFRWLHERWYWDIDRHYWFEGVRVGRP